MDAIFSYSFLNKYQDSTVAQSKVEWVCDNKASNVASGIGATSFSHVETDHSAEITIGLPAELAAMSEAQRISVLKGLFKGTLEKWIPQINITEQISFS